MLVLHYILLIFQRVLILVRKCHWLRRLLCWTITVFLVINGLLLWLILAILVLTWILLKPRFNLPLFIRLYVFLLLTLRLWWSIRNYFPTLVYRLLLMCNILLLLIHWLEWLTNYRHNRSQILFVWDCISLGLIIRLGKWNLLLVILLRCRWK